MTLRAVCFDLDDTLVEPSWHEAAIDAVAERFAPACGLPLLDLESAGRAAHADVARRVMADWNVGRISGAARNRLVWQDALAALGVTEPSVVDAATEAYSAAAEQSYRAYPDVAGALIQLRQAGLRAAVVTNGAGDAQRAKLRATGLLDRFDEIVVSGELGIAKPDAAIFQAACERLGVELGEAAHVGDSLANDVRGAVGAGLTGVWLNRSGAADGAPAAAAAEGTARDTANPGLEVRSLAQLARVLGYG